MQPFSVTPERIGKLKLLVPAFQELAERYGNDAALRARIEAGDVADILPELGITLPPGIETRVVANTADTFHVVLPPDPNVVLADETLSAVAGGKTVGSAGTIGSVGSMATSCSPSTASSAGTTGSAGTL